MKNGLLTYVNYYRNIGDYIQSLAAKQYLKSVDEYICREELNNYNGDDVKLIMNGWYMHEPQNWPPSNKIHPLFVAFHMNSTARDIMLSEKGLNYLRNHEPIGCRDNGTKELLIDNGIKAYFSGCLTLTLGKKYHSDIKDDSIYIVDPIYKSPKSILGVIRCFTILARDFRKIQTLSKHFLNKTSLIAMYRTSVFYSIYSKIFEDDVLLNAKYINHKIRLGLNDADLFLHAEGLLKQYAKAKLVITSRIHCALPSLGFETPVIYIDRTMDSETSECRLDGLRELFNSIIYDVSANELLGGDFVGKIGLDTVINNKSNYTRLKDALESKCINFMNDKN